MPLATPKLDDRRFQDIVDEAKSRIPRYCPEWTDHNVSDPGVALIELFAWMTDLLLYRVNQVPDKLYVKFLELIGVRLDPPRAARAPVTFYLSAPQPNDVVIPEGTEVATVRTETHPDVVFSTEAELIVRRPDLRALLSGSDQDQWITHDLRHLAVSGHPISVFERRPAVGDALYVALERDHSQHVLALVMDCELASGAGVDPADPPLAWQVWQGEPNGWVSCEVEYDGTGGLNTPGEVILHLPRMAETELNGLRAFWLRGCLVEARPGQGTYYVSPQVRRLEVEARGGTVGARHAQAVSNEMLGSSDGSPGQTFMLMHTPVLVRDPRRDHLVVQAPGGVPEVWHEVEDFAESHPDDRHYTLDSLDGTLTLGPALLQPDGSVCRFGATPAKGSRVWFARYQHGGGVAGNLPRGALCVAKSAVPYVAHVLNRQPAIGGRDAQSLDDAKLRAPSVLRTRTRAVTADDYEYLARQVAGVARAHCLTPGAQPSNDPSQPPPGDVVLLVLPQVGEPEGRLTADQLGLPDDLRSAVVAYLDARRVLGVRLDVRAPRLSRVSVEVSLRPAERPDDVRRRAEAALYRYLNPYVGGPRGEGWPVGRELHAAELYSLLQGLPGVEYIDEVRVLLDGSEAPARLQIPGDAVLCSDCHRVRLV